MSIYIWLLRHIQLYIYLTCIYIGYLTPSTIVPKGVLSLNMSSFVHEEPKHSSKHCRFFPSVLRDALARCHIFCGRLSSSSIEEEYLPSDMDDEQEVIVLAIRSRAMEAKMRRKAYLVTESDLHWVLFPTTGELFPTAKGVQEHIKCNKDEDEDDEDREAVFSVGSCLSRCSSASSRDVFFSVGGCSLSRCSSLNGVDFRHDVRRRLIIQEFCHCEGWPFGLYRKSILLPPLPRSPSDSWSWRKGTRMIKML